MTIRPTVDLACSRSPSPEIATIIDARSRDLGGLTVGRVLPAPARRMIGSFIFFDHMGPRSTSRPAAASTCDRIRTSRSRR